MNRALVENLVRHYEGSSSVAPEARLNDLTANLRYILKYGSLLPDEIMTRGVATIRGNHVIAQERKLQTKVYLDQQDITGALLNPDNLFESAFQEINFIIMSAKAQGLQYLPFVPLSIVVDKEPGSYRPYLTFVTRFGITTATHVVAEVPKPPVYNTDNTLHHNIRDDEYLSDVVAYEKATGKPFGEPQQPTQTVDGVQGTPPPNLHPTGPVTPLQAAIAETPEELNESPFISETVAPDPTREESAALYDSSISVPVRKATGVEEVALSPTTPKKRSGNIHTGAARKGGWPKGKPRKPKVDVLDTNE